MLTSQFHVPTFIHPQTAAEVCKKKKTKKKLDPKLQRALNISHQTCDNAAVLTLLLMQEKLKESLNYSSECNIKDKSEQMRSVRDPLAQDFPLIQYDKPVSENMSV